MVTKYRYKTFRCPDNLFWELDEVAEQLEMNPSEFIREAIVARMRDLREKGYYLPKKRGKEVVDHRPQM